MTFLQLPHGPWPIGIGIGIIYYLINGRASCSYMAPSSPLGHKYYASIRTEVYFLRSGYFTNRAYIGLRECVVFACTT